MGAAVQQEVCAGAFALHARIYRATEQMISLKRLTRPSATQNRAGDLTRSRYSGSNMAAMLTIRRFQDQDWPCVWSILRETNAGGDAFAFAPDTPESQMRAIWVEAPLAAYVACFEDGAIVGTYMLKANQPGLGSHVSNCGYAVATQARGRGVAAAMCEHSQAKARAFGFRSMQFNIVVSTNEAAVHLWRKLWTSA
jgi:ribosomal protein S18 acetylase RimI-like enzyme